ncbi:CCR4-NOT transcription complex subunit 1 [Pelomyxa schiedti]|nr:CCR4-NOT transcription complex subunit 1 [Pelomyxa schiedti]
MYIKDHSTLSHILDIAHQEQKANTTPTVLPTILGARPISFALDLSTLASQREFLNLELWLQEQLAQHGLNFAAACVAYLKEKVIVKNSKLVNNFVLTPDTQRMFVKCIREAPYFSELSESDLEDLQQIELPLGDSSHTKAPHKTSEDTAHDKHLPPTQEGHQSGIPRTTSPADRNQILKNASQEQAYNNGQHSDTSATHPSAQLPTSQPTNIASFTPASTGSRSPDSSESALTGVPGVAPTSKLFSEEIEKQANEYFYQIYTQNRTIEDLIPILKRLSSAKKNSKEHDIFNCMINNLFTEYQHFPKYPDKELKITGVLVGSLIQHQVVTFLHLGVALRYVLEALRQRVGSKMFNFGLWALEQFMPRLHEWPQYCSRILQIPHLRQTHPQIISFIEKAIPAASSSTLPQQSQSQPQSSMEIATGEGEGDLPHTHVQVQNKPMESPSSQEETCVTNELGSVDLRAVPKSGDIKQDYMGESSENLTIFEGNDSLQPKSPSEISDSDMQNYKALLAQQTQNNSQPSSPRQTPPPRTVSPRQTAPPISSRPNSMSPPLPTSFTTQHTPPSATTVSSFAQPPPDPALNSTKPLSAMSPPVPPPRSEERPLSSSPQVPNVVTPIAQYATAVEAIPPQYSHSESQQTVADKFCTPPTAVIDRIHFLINNLAPTNLDVKVSEMRELLKPDYIDYMAQYLVSKRLCAESTNVSLYRSFVDGLNNLSLTHRILKQTYEHIHSLLNSNEIAAEVSPERQFLRALGNWLGLSTLARNKPILSKDLPLKDLLIQSIDNGKLLGMMQLTRQILEHAVKSKVFKLPNPWVTALLRVAAEIHHLQGIKQNVVFEVEFLFKAFNVNLSSFKSSPQLGERLAAIQQAALAAQQQKQLQQQQAEAQAQARAQAQQAQQAQAQTLAQSSAQAQQEVLPQQVPPQQQPPQQTVAQQLSPNAQQPVQSQQIPVNLSAQQKEEQSAQSIASKYPESKGATEMIVPDLQSYIHVVPSVPLTQTPQLVSLVTLAVDKAIREIITPVVERSVTIGCLTTQHLCMKDFALEPDETKMRRAAHLMVQSLAGSLALVTCKDPLRVSMMNHLRAFLLPTLQGLDAQQLQHQQQLLDQAVQTICSDNLEMACSFIEKAAIDKAIQDTEQAFSKALASRRKAREMGQAFVDVSQISSRPMLPESLCPKPGGLSPQQLQVYEEFANVPLQNQQKSEQQSKLDGELEGTNTAKVPHEVMERFNILMNEIDKVIMTVSMHPPDIAGMPEGEIHLAYIHQDHALHQLIASVGTLVVQSSSGNSGGVGDATAVVFTQRIFTNLYQSNTILHRDVYLAMLEVLADLCKRVVLEVITSLLTKIDDTTKLNKDILVGLINSHLVLLSDLDSYLLHIIDNGDKRSCVELAASVVQSCVIESHSICVADIPNTCGLLDRLCKSNQHDRFFNQLYKLLEEAGKQPPPKDDRIKIRSSSSGIIDQGDVIDPPGFKEQVNSLLKEWCATLTQHNPSGTASSLGSSVASTSATTKACAAFLGQPQVQAMFKTEEIQERFFRVCVELCVQNYCSREPTSDSPYQQVDAFGKLIVVLVTKCIPEQHAAAKGAMLNRVMGIVAKVLQKDHEERKQEFNQRPYFRLFELWLMEFHQVENSSDLFAQQVLISFGQLFLALHPSQVPGFTFAWLELISHRMFMPKLLFTRGQKGWVMMQRLLVELLKFMEPHLRSAEMNEAIRMLYKGTLRVLLVLLHDFPEFLCDFHFSFCDVIPSTCIQMRNLILSAYPTNMRLPDPFTPNLKVDLLPEIQSSPQVRSNYVQSLSSIKVDLDNYLKTGQPVNFLFELPAKLLLPGEEALRQNTKYIVPLINSLVLYVGMQAISNLHNKNGQSSNISQTAPMGIFQFLIMYLDNEGRFLFLNAIANQLRYPNTHTHYFSCVLLYLFAEAPHEIIQEQITRVLLERLVVSRPHPWGLLITFIELIKNPRYSFWSHSFTRCAPEIEKLFESVARSCMNTQPQMQTPPTQQQPPPPQQPPLVPSPSTQKLTQPPLQKSVPPPNGSWKSSSDEDSIDGN